MTCDIKQTELGREFEYNELCEAAEAVWGGITWPSGERAGCVVVVAAGRIRYEGGYEISVLEEFASFDVHRLVIECVSMDAKYWISQPREDQRDAPTGRWIGDPTHEASKIFLREANEAFRYEAHVKMGSYNRRLSGAITIRKIIFRPSVLLEQENLYDFLLPRLGKWRIKGYKLLFTKECEIAGSLEALDGPGVGLVADLKVGAYPDIEALGCVCVELQRHLKRRDLAVCGGDYNPADRGVTSLLEV